MTPNRVVAIIQARMGSTRLPGKILLPLGGQSVLANVVARTRRAALVDEVIVATTTSTQDEVVVSESKRLGVAVYRGSEDDVLSRYVMAARESCASAVVRITSDCPLLDSSVVDQVIRRYADSAGELDYVSNTLVRTYPRGLDVEVFSTQALETAAANAAAPSDREHVTPFFQHNPGQFRLESVERLPDLSHHRWTLDTPEDYRFMLQVFMGVPITVESTPLFTEVIRYLNGHSEISAINACVQQKVLGA